MKKEKSDALCGLALFVSATALRTFRTQLVGLAAMVAAILPAWGTLHWQGPYAHLWSICMPRPPLFSAEDTARRARCDAGGFYEV